MLKHSLIGASVAVIATAACAQEQPGTAEAPALKEETAIVDASQVATREDAKTYAESEFALADLNMDGKVDRAEFIEYASIRAPAPVLNEEGDVTASNEAQTAEEQFAEMSNGDEELSQTELVETRVAQFDEADENDDAALDEEERIQFAMLTTPKAPQNAL